MALDLEAEFLQRRPVNFRPLTPLNFLLRAADVFPDKVAVIHGDERITWRQHAERCKRLASALMGIGVRKGESVAILAPNTPAMLEAHFGVPMAGALLNALNTRLDAAGLAFILKHCEAKVFLVDKQYSGIAKDALALLATKPIVIDIEDTLAEGGERIGQYSYEEFLQRGHAENPTYWPEDEFEAFTVNYTSGTTGDPKGVVFHHRGAYLNSLSQLLHHKVDADSVYLWILPMFHGNGWCFTWAIAAVGATHVCLRKVVADEIFNAIETHGVTHLCCAPTVLGMLIDSAAAAGRKLARPVVAMTAGSAPPAAILKEAEALGFTVRHVYGTTEMHTVVTFCDWHREWDDLAPDERAKKMARQGVRTAVTDTLIVADPITLEPVPHNGSVMGEVLYRGSNCMKGYLKNPAATEEAFAGNFYHIGDLAVVHEDGYIEIKDRLKDIIISGGENISSIEIEDVLFKHPAVSSVAVIAMQDEQWGERPCAFVQLKPGASNEVSEKELLDFCRARLAKFKVPKRVIFGPIEQTATGKVQKFKLRQRLQELRESA